MRKGFFSHHEACPRCRERGDDSEGDNLGVYADGHKYCFKCTYFVPSGKDLNVNDLSERAAKLEQKEPINYDARRLALPSDYSPHLAVGAMRWLDQYGITNEETKEHRIGWSPVNESLVFPVFDLDNTLIFYQERFFNNPKRKYKTHGKSEEVFNIIGPLSSSLVLVEDMLSAIKISRQFEVMPLYGSSISQERIGRLSKLYKHILIWLDNDKAHYAIRRAVHMRPHFDKVTTVVTEFDPKEYDDTEIADFIHGDPTP